MTTQMRAENKNAFDNLFAALRRVGLLIEFPEEVWDAYNRKHFGPGCKITLGEPPTDPKDLAWNEPHRRQYDEPEPDL